MSQFKDIHSLLSFATCLLYLFKERLTQAHQAQPEPCVYLRPCRSKPERFEGSARLLALLECFVVFILELPHLNIIISSSILNVSFDSENKILGSRHDCPWVGSAVAWSFILCSNLRSSEPGITSSCKVVIKFLGLTVSRSHGLTLDHRYAHLVIYPLLQISGSRIHGLAPPSSHCSSRTA
jgi:hypothetical protein